MKTVKRLSVFIPICALLLAFFGLNLFAVHNWLFKGRIIDADTKKPIEGVEMVLKSTGKGQTYRMTTKKDGTFMRRLPLGQFHLIMKCEGYLPQDDYVRHPPDAAEALVKDYEMKPGEGVLMSDLSEEEQKELIENREQLEKEMEEAKKAAGNLKQLFEEALKLKKAGDYDKAIDNLLKALQIDTEQPNLLGHLGDAYLKKGDFDNSIIYFNKAIELNPEDANFRTNLGNAYVKKGMIPEAKVEFEKAIALDPSNAALNYYNMGAVLYNAGSADAALEPFQKCILADPSYGPAYYLLAMCQLNGGDFDGAIKSMEKYLELEPKGQYAEQVSQMLPALKQQIGK